jgi:succinate-semialdehyde dehydrogenase/glutarate-semialdehyde dehydrogenase
MQEYLNFYMPKMPIETHNPATKSTIKSFPEMSIEEVNVIARKSHSAFDEWKLTTYTQRSSLITSLGTVLNEDKSQIAEIISIEMGKPISESIAEVEKSVLCSEYYAENTEEILKDQIIETEASESYIRYDPLGTIFAVMPWNYPLWQVIRFAVPAIMAGNTVLLKHSSNVPQTALLIEELFLKAGFPMGIFQTLLIGSSLVERVIQNEHVKAITLTGSEKAGSKVASIAAAEIKKSVLELGGSDPFIVLEDADLDLASKVGVKSRLLNTGQSCIAAKRFIVHSSIHDEFVEKLANQMEKLVVGNPLKSTTQIGPLATAAILENLKDQIQKSKEMGAKILIGGQELNMGGYYYAPTLLTDVTSDMPVFNEETFGPVSPVIRFDTDEEAVQIANDTQFGLGASIWTTDIERAKQLIPQIEAGSVFINSLVRSDPRMPFGGIKKSGYGRELSSFGIKEFTNIKSISIT